MAGAVQRPNGDATPREILSMQTPGRISGGAEYTNLEELEGLAKLKLPKMVFDYYASGADTQWTVAENRSVFARWKILPRMMVDVSSLDTSVQLLGQSSKT